MKTMEELAQEQSVEITEDLDVQYDKLIEALQAAKENKQPIDEGLFGAIGGAIAGETVMPALMRALCKALGVDDRGQLGSLLTSRLIMTAVGTTVGWKI